MKVRFELIDLDTSLAKDGDFERALVCYLRATAVSERTETKEIAFWYGVPVEKRSGIEFLALRINGVVSGFALSRYLADTKLLILDYMCIDPQHGSNAAYFSFIELFCKRAEGRHEVSYMLTEVTFNMDGLTKDEPNRYWLRVLELVGFKVVQLPYMQPSLVCGDPSQHRRGALMVRSNEPSTQMSNDAYLTALKSIYLDHYLAWYEPISTATTSCRNLLNKEINSVSAQLKKMPFINLNGSLKHAKLVSAEETEPSVASKTVYVMTSYALLCILATSGAIAGLSVGAGLGPYVALVIFSVASLTFVALVALVVPSRIGVFKEMNKLAAKLFSGLR